VTVAAAGSISIVSSVGFPQPATHKQIKPSNAGVNVTMIDRERIISAASFHC
jgi:hypothetical protein